MGGTANKTTVDRFRSRSEHTLDAKGRLNIPSRFREVLKNKYTNDLILTNWDKSIRAYPLAVWTEIEDKLLGEGRNQLGMSGFIRYVISGVTPCSLDRQGRILLPASLRSEFDIEKEVVLNGMLEHFEVWNKAAWVAETRKTRENFKNYETGLSALGIL